MRKEEKKHHRSDREFLPARGRSDVSMISPYQALKILGREPARSLGQHFLIHQATAEKIAAAVCPGPGDVVVEIGSGLGALTVPLSRSGARVVAVEIDPRLADFLGQQLRAVSSSGLVSIECTDVLQLDLPELCRRFHRKLKIVGNLPYNISSPVLFKLMAESDSIQQAVLMLQDEVAERLLAAPGGRDYGILSVMVAYHSEASRFTRLKASQFYPPPRVDSTVVRLCFRPCPLEPRVNADWLLRVVKAAFGYRRKTVRNSLLTSKRADFPGELLDAALEEAGVDPGRRPESLSLQEFLNLAQALQTSSLTRKESHGNIVY
ncbi:MAG: 16S rRNA (adenine(1518)-N(6)/adenine(1519)-N(6))-dimethyltransferase RsmA [Syntrophobacteria bacterium]